MGEESENQPQRGERKGSAQSLNAQQAEEKPKRQSRAAYLLRLDFAQLRANDGMMAAAQDLEPLASEIADLLVAGVAPTLILKSVMNRLSISKHIAVHAIRLCLTESGVEFKLPRGHRPKKTALGEDLSAAKPKVSGSTSAVVSPPATHPAPVSTPVAPPQANPTAGAKKAAVADTEPLPDIPRGDLTHTEREKVSLAFFARDRFGGRNASQVSPAELTADELAWLEKLWDLTAPVDPKTGDPYRIRAFTPAGRPIDDRPVAPGGGVMVDDLFVEGLDPALWKICQRKGMGLEQHPQYPDELRAVYPHGGKSVPFPKENVNGILTGMHPRFPLRSS
ncbi:hypothetical protein THIX_60781 [Thiomonas sp. X19]|nr:hypothetical protein [Thiomonas sp. X19]SCC94723.1 hypothetical protein THIX_60781 [Thiomonas sp. X19]